MSKTQIKNWNPDDRPREKLRGKGPLQLTDSELLAILIQNGTKNISAMELAKQLLDRCSNQLGALARLSTRELMKTHGIGMAKAVAIQAALELGRRRQAAEHLQTESITSSNAVFFHGCCKSFSVVDKYLRLDVFAMHS